MYAIICVVKFNFIRRNHCLLIFMLLYIMLLYFILNLIFFFYFYNLCAFRFDVLSSVY